MTFNWTNEKLRRYQVLRDQGLKLDAVCDAMGITARQARYAGELIRRRKRAAGDMVASDSSSDAQRLTHHLDADGLTSEKVLAVKDGQDLDANDLLKAHGFNPEKFIVTSATSNFWGADSQGQPLYQTKIKVKPVDVTVDDILAAVDAHYDAQAAPAVKKGRPEKYLDRTLVIPLFDLHFGISTYQELVPYLKQIKERLNCFYKRVAIIVGGDYFHSDFMSRTMTAKTGGTQLEHVDNIQALRDGSRFFEELVDFAYHHSQSVDVTAIGGNHDRDKQYLWLYAMKQRYALYHDGPRFSLTMATRYAFKLDGVGVLIAHGDFAKRRLPLLFATEYPELWGSTGYHAIFSGHFHKEVTTDESGCVCFQVGTPKPSDNYERNNGYTMARKKLELFDFTPNRLLSIIYLEPDD